MNHWRPTLPQSQMLWTSLPALEWESVKQLIFKCILIQGITGSGAHRSWPTWSSTRLGSATPHCGFIAEVYRELLWTKSSQSSLSQVDSGPGLDSSQGELNQKKIHQTTVWSHSKESEKCNKWKIQFLIFDKFTTISTNMFSLCHHVLMIFIHLEKIYAWDIQ